MPTITISKRALVKELKAKLPLAELKDRISMLGTDLEGIEGDEVTVEVFPNRPDMLSQQGFGRALASFIGSRPGLREYPVRKSGKRCIVDKSVAGCRPYTACAIVTGLRLDDRKIKDIIMVQEKLHITFCRDRKKAAIGIYPLERISFPIRFTGRRPGDIRFQPLEARGEMTAAEILEDHPKGKGYAHLLEGLERYACFEDAKGDIMSLTPIINSHRTGKITEDTSDVFVECSGFDQRVLDECLAMVVTALADMGGTIRSMDIEYTDKTITSPDLSPRRMPLDRKYINRLLGTYLSDKEMGALLERMGHGYARGEVLVPAYRTDILHQADLAEDVAIAYGYENIPETIPKVATVASEDAFEAFCAKVRHLLVGHGLLEAKNYNLISGESQTTRMRLRLDLVKVLHPVSQEYGSLRAWVLPSLMETLQRNKRHEYPQRLFEIGRVFGKAKENNGTGIKERVRAAVILCDEKADYTAIRQVLDDLLSKLDVKAEYREAVHDSFIPGRVARVSVGGDGVAYVGELHPEALTNFELTMPAAAFELNLSVLFEKRG